ELLRRTTRRVHVTEAGEMLMAYCDRILGAVDELSAELDARQGHLRGTVRVGATEVFAMHALPLAIARLAGDHPDILMKSFHLGADAIQQALLEGRIDVGLTVAGPHTAGLDSQVLVQSPAVLVCGQAHPLAGSGEIAAADLETHAFVVPQFFGREHLADLDGFPGGGRRIGATVELVSMAVAMIETGRFVGYLPRIAVAGALRHGSIRELRGIAPGAPFELLALTRPDEAPRPAVTALVERLRATLQDALGIARAA
ncbi:MAG: substrate-binding domain-containing protein, partial [Myxococcota bacterium]